MTVWKLACFALWLPVLSATIVQSGYTQSVAVRAQTFRAPSAPLRAHYEMECSADPSSGRLVGKGTIRFRNTSEEPLFRIAFDWSLNMRQSLSVWVKGVPVSVLKFEERRQVNSPLLYDLPQPLQPDETTEITVEFGRSIEGGDDRTAFTLVQWYPRLWWGFETHDDYDVKVNAPAGYAVATSGRLDTLTGYYHGENIRAFGLFLGANQTVLDTLSGDVLVRAVATTETETCARFLLQAAADAIGYYREKFGFFPYSSLTILPGYAIPIGGYPVATGMVAVHGQQVMDRKSEEYWRAIMAHEVGHQYWLEWVLSDAPEGYGWLMIGLGFYADRDYLVARGAGPEVKRRLMDDYINGVREHLNTTAELTAGQQASVEFDFNNVVTHSKGYSIISALVSVLGEETFERVYDRCLREFAGRRLGSREFQRVCEEEGGQELSWFFDQWARSNRYLCYEITDKTNRIYDEGCESFVKVERRGDMRMPVSVAAYFEDGTSQVTIIDRLLDINVLRFISNAPLRNAVLDPDGRLAMISQPLEYTEEQLKRDVERMEWTGPGREAERLYQEARKLEATDAGMWVKLGMTLYDGEYYTEALDAFRRVGALSEDDSRWKFGCLVWQGMIFDVVGARDQALKSYHAALETGETRSLQHDQYSLRVDQAFVEKRLTEPFVRR